MLFHEVQIKIGFLLGSVRTHGADKLWLDAALMMAVPAEALFVAIASSALLTGVGL